MKNTPGITEIIFEAIDELNRLLPKERRLAKSPECALSGDNGGLDSLGLINLIVATEQKVQERLGRSITLADEKTMSQETNPFLNVQTLSTYISRILDEKIHE